MFQVYRKGDESINGTHFKLFLFESSSDIEGWQFQAGHISTERLELAGRPSQPQQGPR
jgi:hypothetical protein